MDFLGNRSRGLRSTEVDAQNPERQDPYAKMCHLDNVLRSGSDCAWPGLTSGLRPLSDPMKSPT